MHGGTVHAASGGVGTGATFEVSIPLVEPGSPDPGAERAEVAAIQPAVPLNALDVLLVEDDDDAAAALSAILTNDGAQVRTARDCEAALDEIEAATPDLIISDIGLPGRDGNDLIREVRIREAVASQARTPAIALTAFTRQQDRRAAIESGFDAVCGKPLRLQELMSAIENVLGPLQ
ncbi:Transcriptional regulatory protein YycF [compost metagenome]